LPKLSLQTGQDRITRGLPSTKLFLNIGPKYRQQQHHHHHHHHPPPPPTLTRVLKTLSAEILPATSQIPVFRDLKLPRIPPPQSIRLGCQPARPMITRHPVGLLGTVAEQGLSLEQILRDPAQVPRSQWASSVFFAQSTENPRLINTDRTVQTAARLILRVKIFRIVGPLRHS
jgi:hypothetical protein